MLSLYTLDLVTVMNSSRLIVTLNKPITGISLSNKIHNYYHQRTPLLEQNVYWTTKEEVHLHYKLVLFFFALASLLVSLFPN
jgi:hypothetical protein